MNRYYINYPRDFANEYTVYVVANEQDEDRLLRCLPTAERIRRASAVRRAETLPAMYRRTGQQHYGGWPSGTIGGTISERLADAVTQTREDIAYMEGYRDTS